ncbi:hypothetical protein K461DRAFT_294262 [Myriangium duriaei CBS 260.36]|uniref:Transcription factor TFIIIC triple barrel domain-containing protein n=1 Tax=Myriangium duriaei CBS 260.36 TaxID=1168546 RepID=A0A9P4MJZ7_9PEZI|nr:hypothetical protein K461DRAFT_294262 [Myriangium duriaei CBS 260.36]
MADEEDEWEYEFDEEDPEASPMEVFYITVDFSTHTAPSVPTKKPGTTSARKSTSQRQAENASNKDIHDRPDVDQSDDPNTATQTSDQMQILDLRTPNPLISYNSQIYTCHWATDIGTSLHFSSSNLGDTDTHPPLRSYPTFDLQAKSRARLIAVPARLKSTTTTSTTSTAPPPTTNTQGWHLDTREGDRIVYNPDGTMQISVPANASAGKQSQAKFLERWAEIKARRGRTDPVPIKSVRNYTLPEGWEEERETWLRKGREDAAGFGGLKPRRRRAGKILEEEEEAMEMERAGTKRKRAAMGESGGASRATPVEVSDDDDDGGDSDESEDDDEDDEDEEADQVPGSRVMDFDV